jgi:hypothetical protein
MAPVSLLRRSRPGDLVLDPFFGSGTTGAAIEKHGRRWIGFDLGYEQLAKERTAQRSLALGGGTAMTPVRCPQLLTLAVAPAALETREVVGGAGNAVFARRHRLEPAPWQRRSTQQVHRVAPSIQRIAGPDVLVELVDGGWALLAGVCPRPCREPLRRIPLDLEQGPLVLRDRRNRRWLDLGDIDPDLGSAGRRPLVPDQWRVGAVRAAGTEQHAHPKEDERRYHAAPIPAVLVHAVVVRRRSALYQETHAAVGASNEAAPLIYRARLALEAWAAAWRTR